MRSLTVILSEAKDPDALRPASIPSDLSAPPSSPSGEAYPHHPKIKFKKSACFPTVNLLSFSATFSPQIHHDLPRKYHVLHLKICKTPSKIALFASLEKKQKKKTPKPCCGPGVIGLQAARKPNSVLDDHSSTRRITAAL
jgi:hypothetical protein